MTHSHDYDPSEPPVYEQYANDDILREPPTAQLAETARDTLQASPSRARQFFENVRHILHLKNFGENHMKGGGHFG